MEFHGRKIITEEVKSLPRPLVNKLSTNAVANDQKSMHKMFPTINNIRSRLPTAPNEEDSIQNINNTFPNTIIPKTKSLRFSGQYTSRHKN